MHQDSQNSVVQLEETLAGNGRETDKNNDQTQRQDRPTLGLDKLKHLPWVFLIKERLLIVAESIVVALVCLRLAQVSPIPLKSATFIRQNIKKLRDAIFSPRQLPVNLKKKVLRMR